MDLPGVSPHVNAKQSAFSLYKMMTFQLNVDMVGFQCMFLYYSGNFFCSRDKNLLCLYLFLAGGGIWAIGHIQVTAHRSKFSPSTV